MTTPATSSRPGCIAATLHFDQSGSETESARCDLLNRLLGTSLLLDSALEEAMKVNPTQRDAEQKRLVRRFVNCRREGGRLHHVFVPVSEFDRIATLLALSGVAWLQVKEVPYAKAKQARDDRRRAAAAQVHTSAPQDVRPSGPGLLVQDQLDLLMRQGHPQFPPQGTSSDARITRPAPRGLRIL